MHVLVIGLSARAAAESAAAAGFEVTALDAFGDLDQHPSVRALAPGRGAGRPFSPRSAVRAAATIDCDAAVYLSGFENHPRAVSSLASGRTLWGNPPEVLSRVRDPGLLAEALRRNGLRAPAVYTDGQPAGLPGVNPGDRGREFLVKPRRSGGGLGVRAWRAGTPVPPGCYLQERVPGVPGSVLFVAAARQPVVLGVTRQLIGEQAFGACGYRYCGNILLGSGNDPERGGLFRRAEELARVVTERFDLVGVNGIDFIDEGGTLCAIEVNPRWCASMELVERAGGAPVFAAHAAACASGALPQRRPLLPDRAARRPGVLGKAVVFATRDVVAGDTTAWVGDPSVRDLPRPGEAIARGQPICTVFAGGADEEACAAALAARAGRVYAEIDARGGRTGPARRSAVPDRQRP